MPDAAKPGTPALDEGADRIAWGAAILVFLELAFLVPIGMLLVMGELPAMRFFVPVLVFLLLRLPGDIARATAGGKPLGLAVEGPSKAISWGFAPHGLHHIFTGANTLGPLWVLGAAVALAGLALWGHHGRAKERAPRVARLEGVTGALITPFGLAAAATVLRLAAPWDVVVPVLVLVVAGAVGARGIGRLLVSPRDRADPTGWAAWYQGNFFRLTLLIAATVAFLLVRDALAGMVPFFFLFEYSFAVFLAASFLWSLRTFARKNTMEDLPLGPHRTHQQVVERQSEPGFDQVERAFGRYLETGETDDVAVLVQRLDRQGDSASGAFREVLATRADTGVLLVHPGWLYAGRAAVLLLLLWALLQLPDPNVVAALMHPLLALGLYATQWNRYGGPWWVKSAIGMLGAFWFLAFVTATGGAFAGVLMLIPVALLALPFVHPLRARRGRPLPRYQFVGLDPEDAIRPLIARYDHSLRLRALWLGVIGVIVFVVVGEIARVVEEVTFVFSLYLALAGSFLLAPAVVSVGLRVGRQQVRQRNAAARKRREAVLGRAFERLGRTYGASPAMGTSAGVAAETEKRVGVA